MRRRLTLIAAVILAGLVAISCGLRSGSDTPAVEKARVLPALPSSTGPLLFTLTPSPEPSALPVVLATPSAQVVIPEPTGQPSEAVSVQPTATPTAIPPTQVPSPVPSDTAVPPTASPLPSPTQKPASPSPPPSSPTVAAVPRLAPQERGEWDMEAGFVPGTSPLGEDCPGWAVATGWQAFVAPGDPASSCLNGNKNPANVKSGDRSQEITFDFISAEAGIWRHARTIPGHRYQIQAWGKHIRSQSPVELSLGVDLTGGEDWQAASVTWHPWDETGEDVWTHTQVTVKASSEALTVSLKGHHPFAAQGGATMFDDVRVVDLGP